MSDRQAWLDLTVEEALEPELPICDPHHHLWHHPTSRYLVNEFEQDIAGGHRILKTVFVECQQFYDEGASTVELQPVGETAAVDSMTRDSQNAGRTAIAAGIVGFADMATGDEVRAVLEKHLEASARFRGIRHATAWHPDSSIRNAHTRPPEELMSSEKFRAGIKHLEALDLSFDAWLYHPQLPELTKLAQAFPGLNIVLNHMAGPLGIGPYAGSKDATFDEWRTGLEGLSHCENVSVKLGGRAMSMSGFGWSKQPRPPTSAEMAAAMTPYFDTCIDLFGPENCMFESNFPVDKASCAYTVLWNAFKRATSTLSPAERQLLFHDTAVRVYRLDN